MSFSVFVYLSIRHWLHDLHQLGPLPGHGASAPAAVSAQHQGGPQGVLPGVGSGVLAGRPANVSQHALRAPAKANLHGVLQLRGVPLHSLPAAPGLRRLLLLSAHHHRGLLCQDQPQTAHSGQAELYHGSAEKESQGQHHHPAGPLHFSGVFQSLPPQCDAVHGQKDTTPASL